MTGLSAVKTRPSWLAQLILCGLVASGCSPTAPVAHAQESAQAGRAAPPTREETERYFPIAGYARFPAEVRPLMQEADAIHEQCSGVPSAGTARACARSRQLMSELERRGWCWGGSSYGYEQRWVRCTEDEARRSGQN